VRFEVGARADIGLVSLRSSLWDRDLEALQGNDIQRVLNVLSAHCMRPGMLLSPVGKCSITDELKVARSGDKLKKTVELARQLGSDSVRVFPFKSPDSASLDPIPYARTNAQKLGATHVIDPQEDDARKQVYDIIPADPDLVVEAAGPIAAVELMAQLRRRATRWNVFRITTHETLELDGGLTHFLEGRMDANFGTNPAAMRRAIRLMESGLVNTEDIISHRSNLSEIHRAIEVMGQPERNKVMIQV